jgi:uncharacterized membrane protein
MTTYYGLIGIGIVIMLTVFVGIWLDYFTKHMNDDTEPYDEYEVEQARLSWQIRKSSYKANRLTAINAARGEK